MPRTGYKLLNDMATVFFQTISRDFSFGGTPDGFCSREPLDHVPPNEESHMK